MNVMRKNIFKYTVLYLSLFSIVISLCACTPQSNMEPDVNSQSSDSTTEIETDVFYIESASSDYAYTQLGKGTNGAAKQTLYNRMKAKAPIFHNGAAAIKNVAFYVKYDDLGLSEAEIFEVWLSFKEDNPLYYWISNIFSYNDNIINILADEEYISVTNRTKYNKRIYDSISEYLNMTSGEMSAYEIALIYHDAIINAIDYAYETDETTPQDDPWAHNILGVFVNGKGVCESYARTFQLLLNVSGIDNIYVSGIGGDAETGMGNHAWNLIKLDDGEWYWCDLTWDDVPELGVQYDYFCVNDTQNVNWIDSYGLAQEKSFLDLHQPGVTIGDQTSLIIDLPPRATNPYVH